MKWKESSNIPQYDRIITQYYAQFIFSFCYDFNNSDLLVFIASLLLNDKLHQISAQSAFWILVIYSIPMNRPVRADLDFKNNNNQGIGWIKAELPISRYVVTSYTEYCFRNGYCNTSSIDTHLYWLLNCDIKPLHVIKNSLLDGFCIWK